MMIKTAAILVGVTAVVVAGLLGYQRLEEYKADTSTRAAEVMLDSRIAHVERARAAASRLSSIQPELDSSKREVDRLRALLKAKTGQIPVTPTQEPTKPEIPTHPILETAEKVKDELINAQSVRIAVLERAYGDQKIRADEYQAALEDEIKRGALKDIAHQAQLGALKGALLRGRIEGFAAGFITGAVVGRPR